MVNYMLDFVEMPTPAARASSTISPLTPADIPAVLALGAGVLRLNNPADLEAELFRNPYYPRARCSPCGAGPMARRWRLGC